MCAVCHTRADHEDWSRKTFFYYKHHPCVSRHKAEPDRGKKVNVTIKLPGSIEAWNEERQNAVLSAISAHLKIPPSEVTFEGVGAGSVLLTVSVPESLAQELQRAADEKDPDFFKLMECVDTIEVVEVSPGVSWWSLVSKYLSQVFFASLLTLAVLYGLGAAPSRTPSVSPPVRVVAETSLVSGLGNGTPGILVASVLGLMAVVPGFILILAGSSRQRFFDAVVAKSFFIVGLTAVVWMFVKDPLFDWTGPWGQRILFEENGSPGWSTWFYFPFVALGVVIVAGTIVDRIKTISFALFSIGWVLLVFCPLAWIVWGADGWANQARDLGGGLVVHCAAGCSGLLMAWFLGPRLGFGRTLLPPQVPIFTMLGSGLFWIGSFGLHSPVGLEGVSAFDCFGTGLLAPLAGVLAWTLLDWIMTGRFSLVGCCHGLLAGIVATSCGFAFYSESQAFWLGCAAAACSYAAMGFVARAGVDESYQAFSIHAIAGVVGALWVSIAVPDGLAAFNQQMKAVLATVGIAVVGTGLLAIAIKISIGLRISPEEEHGMGDSEPVTEGKVNLF